MTIILFTTIYNCIYGILDYETQIFNEEVKQLLSSNSINLYETIELISKKHIRLFSILTHAIEGLTQYTDLAVMNSTIIIIFSISVFKYYSSIGDALEAIQYLLIIISSIYVGLLLLIPIGSMEKSIRDVKNTLLNNYLIWESKNEKVQLLASSIVSRIEGCEYHGRLFGLVTFNERTIPLLLILVVILSALLKAASN
uniref:Gustatory receptor n=1 Tax=Parastrongyloides trichosuri TaxID=131310 RepID=A0A0N4Z5K1_PARTI